MEFQEFPKHVTVGVDEDGAAVTKVVNTAEEEAALAAENPPATDAQPENTDAPSD